MCSSDLCCSRDPEFISPGLQSLCSILSLYTVDIKDEEKNIIKEEKIKNDTDMTGSKEEEIKSENSVSSTSTSTSTSTPSSGNHARDRSIRLVVAQCITRLCRSNGVIEYPPLVRNADL